MSSFDEENKSYDGYMKAQAVVLLSLTVVLFEFQQSPAELKMEREWW